MNKLLAFVLVTSIYHSSNAQPNEMEKRFIPAHNTVDLGLSGKVKSIINDELQGDSTGTKFIPNEWGYIKNLYLFDQRGNLTKSYKITEKGDTLDFTLYSHNKNNQLINLKKFITEYKYSYNTSNPNELTLEETKFQYDPFGRLLIVTYNNETVTNKYDSNGLLEKTTFVSGNSSTLSKTHFIKYEYDKKSNLLQKMIEVHDTEYSWDSKAGTTTFSYKDGKLIGKEFIPSDDRISQEFKINELGLESELIEGDTTESFGFTCTSSQYNDHKDLKYFYSHYTGDGDMISKINYSYVYDSQNNWTEKTTKNKSTHNGPKYFEDRYSKSIRKIEYYE